MKKLLSAMLALCMALSLCPAALAAQSGMDNFVQVNTYDNRFADVPQSHWAASVVRTCYEYDLMAGVSADSFSPGGSLTVAQALVMADRIHEIYASGSSTLTNGKPWYQPYVDYAVANGIIGADAFADYTANVTRAQMVQILYNAVPAEVFSAINTFYGIPDVLEDHPNAEAIHAFYAAGVLTGSDRYGVFHPDSDITRAEAAAILARVALPEQRQKVVLLQKIFVGAGGSDLFTFDFPQEGMMTPDGADYFYQDGEVYLSFTASFTPIGNTAGMSIEEIFSHEMANESWSAAFQGMQYDTATVHYGDMQAYLTTEVPGSQTEDGKDVAGLVFLYKGNLVTVGMLGLNCEELFRPMLKNLEILGNLRTDG